MNEQKPLTVKELASMGGKARMEKLKANKKAFLAYQKNASEAAAKARMEKKKLSTVGC